jgi:hypothetical protein
MIQLFDQVETQEPNETDIYNHSFVGTVIDFKGDLAIVEDGDGDCFDIEIWRLTVIED